MYFEEFPTCEEAIARESQLKKWRRDKKNALIQQLNPRWEDLGFKMKKKPSVEQAIYYNSPLKDPSATLGIAEP